MREGALQTVILAGGLGTRMRALAGDTPKHLIPVNGRPFAAYQLEWLARCGVTDVVYCIGHQGDRIRAFVGDGRPWRLRARYVDDGATLRGTAGALRLALDASVLEGRFFVLYGDSFLPIDFAALGRSFLAQDRPAMMAVLRNEGRWDASNVRLKGDLVELYRKGKGGDDAELPYIDYGVTALSRELVSDHVPSGAVADLASLYERLSLEGRLAGFEVFERFYEIGSPAGLADFESWAKNHATSHPPAG